MLQIEIKILVTTAHIILENEQVKTASYRIQNDSRIFSLAIYQKGSAEDTRFIDSYSEVSFTWSKLLDSHEVIIEFLLGPKALEGKDTKSMYILNLDKLNQMLKIKIKEAPQDFDVLYISVHNEGVSRILKFSDMPLKNFKDQSDIILTSYNFSIPRLGISLIEHFKNKSKELIYFTVVDFIILAQVTEKD